MSKSFTKNIGVIISYPLWYIFIIIICFRYLTYYSYIPDITYRSLKQLYSKFLPDFTKCQYIANTISDKLSPEQSLFWWFHFLILLLNRIMICFYNFHYLFIYSFFFVFTSYMILHALQCDVVYNVFKSQTLKDRCFGFHSWISVFLLLSSSISWNDYLFSNSLRWDLCILFYDGWLLLTIFTCAFWNKHYLYSLVIPF